MEDRWKGWPDLGNLESLLEALQVFLHNLPSRVCNLRREACSLPSEAQHDALHAAAKQLEETAEAVSALVKQMELRTGGIASRFCSQGFRSHRQLSEPQWPKVMGLGSVPWAPSRCMVTNHLLFCMGGAFLWLMVWVHRRCSR